MLSEQIMIWTTRTYYSTDGYPRTYVFVQSSNRGKVRSHADDKSSRRQDPSLAFDEERTTSRPQSRGFSGDQQADCGNYHPNCWEL